MTVSGGDGRMLGLHRCLARGRRGTASTPTPSTPICSRPHRAFLWWATILKQTRDPTLERRSSCQNHITWAQLAPDLPPADLLPSTGTSARPDEGTAADHGLAPTSAEADIGALPCHGQWLGIEVDDDKGPSSGHTLMSGQIMTAMGIIEQRIPRHRSIVSRRRQMERCAASRSGSQNQSDQPSGGHACVHGFEESAVGMLDFLEQKRLRQGSTQRILPGCWGVPEAKASGRLDVAGS